MKIKRYLFIILSISVLPITGCNEKNTPDSDSTSADTSTSTDTTDTNTGDDDNDFVENQTWNSTVSIVFNGTSATISDVPDGVTITNESGYVVISSTVKHIAYSVSGEGIGQLRFDSTNYKFKLTLDNLTLTCNDGPAINNQCHKSCYLVLSGTNTLSDKNGYSTEVNGEDQKAALFSEGQVLISGSGSITINGNNKHALASDDYIRLREGSLVLNATVADGLHTNDGVIINGGSLTINALDEGINVDEGSFYMTDGAVTVTTTGTSAKGIKSYGNLTIEGGEVEVTTPGKESEGIESKAILTISGGTVNVTAYDDAINSASHMYLKGGTITAVSTGNDGIDSNGNMYIQGGNIIACGTSSPECGLDANEEGGYSVFFTGGNLLALGGGNSVPSSSSSTQAYISASVSVSAGMTISLSSGSETICSFVVPQSYSASSSGHGGGGWWAPRKEPGKGGGNNGGGLLITAQGLTSGNTYTLSYGSSTTSVTSQTTGSSAGGGRGGW